MELQGVGVKTEGGELGNIKGKWNCLRFRNWNS